MPLNAAKIYNKQFITSSAAQSTRIDGRRFTQSRDINIEFSFINNGAVKLKLGETFVTCVVTGEIVEPASHAPKEGQVSFNVDITPMATGPTTSRTTFNKACQIGNIISMIFRKTRALDTEALCVQKSFKVWSINVEIHVLCDDGNVLDAACLATLAGLLHFRRKRKIDLLGNVDSLYSQCVPEMPLSIHHYPVLVTVCCVGSTDTAYLIDPTKEEEEYCENLVSIAVNQFQELCGLKMYGGDSIEASQFPELITMATKEALRRIEILNSALEKFRIEKEVGLKNIWDTYKDKEKWQFASSEILSHQEEEQIDKYVEASKIFNSPMKLEESILYQSEIPSNEVNTTTKMDVETVAAPIKLKTEPLKTPKVETISDEIELNTTEDDFLCAVVKKKKGKRKNLA